MCQSVLLLNYAFVQSQSGDLFFFIISDWRRHLASGPSRLFSHDGDMLIPLDAFDDAEAERELIARGAIVHNASLLPGDTVYVPMGALHGALNARGAVVCALSPPTEYKLLHLRGCASL